ncbi:hypothetical protein FIV42_22630 [Persicimonas caeni]|uniref:Uncharacterized protein n=1 Tax=Persicimonas caeni TaxID=2292766 RepID=A0A4Y6PZK6_PERCE|nr:hypothetical protein [Persicimonas caeni]QDG53437.1 hypothetical protein FIV42_22630 [Persicimonas caeni]QED34658.1 hypothetical protein FRD00_22625 [Persicimonas caeni]
MQLRLPFAVVLTVLFASTLAANAGAQEAEQESEQDWRKPRSLDGLYERIAKDLKGGKPLVIASYYGMWQARADQPDRNLNWGVYYGHKTMLMRAKKDGHIAKNYKHTDWKRVHRAESDADPMRVLVFHQEVEPNARWKKLGVQKSFDVYLVMEAWQGQEAAAKAMVRGLRQNKGRDIAIDDETTINTGQAQVTGYFGHNFFYDYVDFYWDGLDDIKGDIARPTGVFAVGCKTARVPGFGRLITPNAYAVLYSRTLMASEGYSTLALADGLLRALDSKAMVGLADRTYRYFQKHAKPDRRVGRPFVSHGFRMFEDTSK